MTPKYAEDLIFVHSNLRLLSRKSLEYLTGEIRFWDVVVDAHDHLMVLSNLLLLNFYLMNRNLRGLCLQMMLKTNLNIYIFIIMIMLLIIFVS
jgi:hypothetical protein